MEQRVIVLSSRNIKDSEAEKLQRLTEHLDDCPHAVYTAFVSQHKNGEELWTIATHLKVTDKLQQQIDDNTHCYDSVATAENLHKLTDTIPVRGQFIDVLWLCHDDISIEDNISLFGALKRLVEWHNATVHILPSQTGGSSDSANDRLHGWVNTLRACVTHNFQDVCDKITRRCWVGGLVIPDKKTVSSVVVPGLMLESVSREDVSHGPWTITTPDTQTQPHCPLAGACLLRYLEYIEEVDVSSVPHFLLVGHKFKLCLQSASEEVGQTRALLKHMARSRQVAYIVRLQYCCPSTECPTAKSTHLSTETWKQQINKNIGNISVDVYSQLAAGTQMFHFLLHRGHSSHDDDDDPAIYAHLLHDPGKINAGFFHSLVMQSMAKSLDPQNTTPSAISTNTDDTNNRDINPPGPETNPDINPSRPDPEEIQIPSHTASENSGSSTTDSKCAKCVRSTLQRLPSFTSESLLRRERDILDAQMKVLKAWTDQQACEGHGAVVTGSDLYQLLFQTRQGVLENETTYTGPAATCNSSQVNFRPIKSDLSIEPCNWAERRALLYYEQRHRTQDKAKSEDDLLTSAPDGDSVLFDVRDVIKMFKKDGSAAVRSRKHKHLVPGERQAGVRLSKVDSEDAIRTHWPDCRDANYHDIYYNKGDTGESREENLVRLKARCVCDEYLSTCTFNPASVSRPRKVKKNKKSPFKSKGQTPRKIKRHTPSKGKATTPKVTPKKSLKGHTPKKVRSHTAGKVKISTPSKSKGLTSKKIGASTCDQRTALERLPHKSHRMSPSLQGASARVVTPPGAQSHSTMAKAARQKDQISSQLAVTFIKPSEGDGKSVSEAAKDRRMSRSERHKRKLQEVVTSTLEAQGICKSDELFNRCSEKLYSATKLFVKDLKTSHNLSEEMRNIAELQVTSVITLEKRKLKK